MLSVVDYDFPEEAVHINLMLTEGRYDTSAHLVYGYERLR